MVRDTKYSSVRDPGPPDDVSVRLADRAAKPARRAQDRGRAAGDVRDGAGRDAGDRPDAADSGVHVQNEQISLRFAQERLFARAYAAFGALAVLLACIGLFGLMSYNVGAADQRDRVRMALGASDGPWSAW